MHSKKQNLLILQNFLSIIPLTDFEMKRLPLKCKPLDDLLEGGIEPNSITEIYGAAGSGKTNFCLQASRECTAMGKKVAYIDTRSVSSERLKQICEDIDCSATLPNILFFNPSSFEEQEKMIKNALEMEDIVSEIQSWELNENATSNLIALNTVWNIGEHWGHILTGCCPNRILITATGSN